MADCFPLLANSHVSQSYGVKLFTQRTCVCLIGVLQMYVRCTVNLCITTLASQKCPSLCHYSYSKRDLVGNLYTETYTVNSGPVSLLISTSAPTPAPVPNTGPVTTQTESNGTSTTTQPSIANGKFCVFLTIGKHPQQCNAGLLGSQQSK